MALINYNTQHIPISHTGAAEAFFFAILVDGLAWVPFWLGSNRVAAWGINSLLFGACVIVFELYLRLKGRPHQIGIRMVWFPVCCFLAVVAWTLTQNFTWVPQVLQHPMWSMAADALNRPLEGSISINRDLTTLSLLRMVTAACVFWLSLQLCRHPDRAYNLVRAIAVIAAAYSFYGLVAAPFGAPIPGFDVAQGEHYVRATFVNRNTFATYAGIGLICNLALLFEIYRRNRARKRGISPLAHFFQVSRQKAIWIAGTSLITLAALVLTASQAGIISSLIGITALFLLIFVSGRHRFRESMQAIVFLLIIVGVCFVFFGDQLAGRITLNKLVDSERMSVFQITLQSIWDAPLLGFGMGTFQDVFPIYRDRSISTAGSWDHAHNSYLEVFQGLGLIFGTILLLAFVYLLFRCLKGIARRRQNMMSSCVAVSVFILVAVDALVDFGFEIQAVTLTAMALLGAGVAQSFSSQVNVAD